MRKSIHAAAYWLNPTFQYDQDSFCKKHEVMVGLLDLLTPGLVRVVLNLLKRLEYSMIVRRGLEDN